MLNTIKVLIFVLLPLSWGEEDPMVSVAEAGGMAEVGTETGGGTEWMGGEECGIPPTLISHCRCKGSTVECGNLTSTAEFSQFESFSITGVSILNSQIQCLNLPDFSSLQGLLELRVSSSGLQGLCLQQEGVRLRHKKGDLGPRKLETLDLSDNLIVKLDQRLELEQLRLVNLSSNLLTSLPSLPPGLEVIDLSRNRLSDTINKDDFFNLSDSLRYINLSGNPWPCSPSLSWMYLWSLSLTRSSRLGLGDVTCRIQNTERASPLLLVMETYHRQVLPKCPVSCTCDLYHFGTSTQAAPIYTVLVNCSGRGLDEFPLAPPHTIILDLSNNKLTDLSFKKLDVGELHYQEISGLILSNNILTVLDNKLLQMKLHRFFKVDRNLLTEVPYDLSLKVQRHYTELSLGDNPWICTCNSEINNNNLWNKVADLDLVTCSDKSDPDTVKGYKISDIDPLILCPPSDEGARREQFLQVVCATLAVMIVVVLSKLAYDYWQYKNKGSLPWIVLNMP